MGQVIVLCYHAVSPDWEAALSVTPARLERQLAALVRAGWRGATFGQAVRGTGFARTVAVTFDDAFASVWQYARPILASLGLPGTVFVPTAFPAADRPLSWPGIEHWLGGPHAGELSVMTWDQLGALAQDGWEIGSHTCSHPHLTELSDERLGAELHDSRSEVARRLGIACDTVAYPYGDADARVAARAQRCGYAAGAALDHHLCDRGPLLAPRIGVYHGDALWRFALKTNGLARRLRASWFWPASKPR